jgi:hypothetical protein
MLGIPIKLVKYVVHLSKRNNWKKSIILHTSSPNCNRRVFGLKGLMHKGFASFVPKNLKIKIYIKIRIEVAATISVRVPKPIMVPKPVRVHVPVRAPLPVKCIP